MNVTVGRALKLNPIGTAAQYARSFYNLLANRRRYDRTPISGTVRLSCPGSPFETVCSCVDISPRGMAIDSPEPLLPGAIIVLHTDVQSQRRVAQVCYCQERGNVYRTGLEFMASDATRGSSTF